MDFENKNGFSKNGEYLGEIFNYLEKYCHLEEGLLQYEPPDGRLLFVISTMKQEKDIREGLNKEAYSNSNNGLIKKIEEISLDNENIKKDVRRVVDYVGNIKYIDSVILGHTKGWYQTFIELLKYKKESELEEGKKESVLEEWMRKNTPSLISLEKGFWIEDACVSEPKCGFCDDYLFLKKTESLGFMNWEQLGLIKYVGRHLYRKEMDEEEEKRFSSFWTFSQGKMFKDNLNKIEVKEEVKLEDGRIEMAPIIDKWLVYRGYAKLIKDFIEFNMELALK